MLIIEISLILSGLLIAFCLGGVLGYKTGFKRQIQQKGEL